MIRYRIPTGTKAVETGGQPAIEYPQGGRVAVDEWIMDLWATAHEKTVAEILALSESPHDLVRAGLACLAEADLLSRGQPPIPAVPHASVTGELVSAIIVAYEGVVWLKDCLPSLLAQTYSPIEILIYDNASPTQEMQQWVTTNYPQVRFTRGETPVSFADANNIAISRAKGKYLMLLNQDVRLEPQAVAEMVRVARQDDRCAAVAAKLRLWWAPRFLNGIGNFVPDHSWGMDLGFGSLDLGQFDAWQQLPSACFALTLIPRAAWEEIEPIDAGFPMYYEDTEWCYRARALGFHILAAPSAVAYHAFGGRIPSGESGGISARKLTNAGYGRLRFALKLLYPPYRGSYLSHYMREDLRNFIASLMRLRFRNVLAYIGAYSRLVTHLPAIRQAHDALGARRETIRDIVSLDFSPPAPLDRNGLPLLTKQVVEDTYLPLFLLKRTRPMPEFSTESRRANLLLISNDIVDTKMAGPGMRYMEMARALSDNLDVSLALPNETNLEIPNVRLLTYQESNAASLEVLVQNHEQALISGYMLFKYPFLKSTHTRLIVDWYDPFYLENYYYYLDRPLDEQLVHNTTAITILNELARVGDFFICGNERQRDLWIGILSANKRINPLTLKDDETLRKLIDVVGVGIPDRPLMDYPILRGVHPAFNADSQIVLWGGGIWNWLDPLTLVKAWEKVAQACPNARLVFLGTRHPNPNVPRHEIVDRLIQAAEKSGEKDRSIFFIEWLSLQDREALLLESDIGVTLHPIHAETRYSIRTRVLDYFWARLPVCITEGDVTSEWVKSYQVGRTVPPGDAQALADELIQMLADGKSVYEESFAALQSQFSWSKVVQPLLQYALEGSSAPDREQFDRNTPMDAADIHMDNVTGTVRRAAYLYATQGTKAMLKQTIHHIKFLLGKH